MLARALGISEAQLLARTTETVAPEVRQHFDSLLERRLTGEPVAYLFGEKELYGRSFAVDRRVLVPRPETEHLIEAALALPLATQPCILDVGVGSGAIAVTLAAELPAARVVATDLSLGALAVARKNALRHGVAERLTLVATDLSAALRLADFDLVVSNPPYVDPAAGLSPEVRDFEPALALFAGEKGRAILDRLVRQAAALRSGTVMILEIGHDQADWLRKTVGAQGELELLEILPDYAGIPRIAILRRRVALSPKHLG